MKKARESAGLSQKQVAMTLGVSAPTVSDWESDKIRPTAENLKKLADLYNVSIDYLLCLTDVPLQFGGSQENPTIRTREPISMLCSLYRISPKRFSEISGVDLDTIDRLSVVAAPLDGREARNPLYDAISDEQYKRINDFFHVDLTVCSARGVFEIPLFAELEVAYKLMGLKDADKPLAAVEETPPDLEAKVAELARQTQELAAKIAAIEEEDAQTEASEELSVWSSVSGGSPSLMKQTKK